MEERMEKIKENNTEKRHSQKRAGGYAIRFFGCWLLTVALAVGMFLFWIYLSFETGRADGFVYSSLFFRGENGAKELPAVENFLGSILRNCILCTAPCFVFFVEKNTGY